MLEILKRFLDKSHSKSCACDFLAQKSEVEHSDLCELTDQMNILTSRTFWSCKYFDEHSDWMNISMNILTEADVSDFESDNIKGLSLRPLVIIDQSLLGFFIIWNFSLRKLNLSSSRGFVKMSASWFSVSTKLNTISFFWTWSLKVRKTTRGGWGGWILFSKTFLSLRSEELFPGSESEWV